MLTLERKTYSTFLTVQAFGPLFLNVDWYVPASTRDHRASITAFCGYMFQPGVAWVKGRPMGARDVSCWR